MPSLLDRMIQFVSWELPKRFEEGTSGDSGSHPFHCISLLKFDQDPFIQWEGLKKTIDACEKHVNPVPIARECNEE